MGGSRLVWPLEWKRNPVLCILAVAFILGWLSYATFCVGKVGYLMISGLPLAYNLLDWVMSRRRQRG